MFNIYYFTGSTQLCPYDGAALTFSDAAVLTCSPAELVCSRNTSISSLDSTSDVPSSCKTLAIVEFDFCKSIPHRV